MKKFRVCLVKESTVEVMAEDWKTARKMVRDHLSNAQESGQEMFDLIEKNSTDWAVDHVEDTTVLGK